MLNYQRVPEGILQIRLGPLPTTSQEPHSEWWGASSSRVASISSGWNTAISPEQMDLSIVQSLVNGWWAMMIRVYSIFTSSASSSKFFSVVGARREPSQRRSREKAGGGRLKNWVTPLLCLQPQILGDFYIWLDEENLWTWMTTVSTHMT